MAYLAQSVPKQNKLGVPVGMIYITVVPNLVGHRDELHSINPRSVHRHENKNLFHDYISIKHQSRVVESDL